MNRLEEIIKTLKTYIGEGVETALDFLEKILDHSTSRYNDFIQIKSRYNSLQRELLLGVLDHSTYDISRNNISKALLILADEITEKDLIPEGGAPADAEDKRGEILYNVPDLMQLNKEEKCAVRIAFDIEHVKRDWEAAPEDVIKSIRVSEIMAVILLNIDEAEPPFAIRSFSETVQFVDKDDFTEWIFYVKPLKVGHFPLLLRVSVIEMINNKEYKKDIVLEEEITVQTDAVGEPRGEEYKSAGTAVTLTNTPLPQTAPPPPAAQVQEAGKKGLQRIAGALLTAVALASAGYFGYTVYSEEQYWDKTGKGGRAGDYEEYLKKYPEGRHSEEARQIMDSLRVGVDTLTRNPVMPQEPGQQVPQEPAVKDESSPVPETAAPKPDPAIKKPAAETPRPAKKKEKPKKETPVTPTPGKTPAPVTNTDTAKAPVPPQAPANSLLRGENFYFRIPRFTVLESEKQDMFFTFYQFNQYREVLVVLGSLGEAKMTPGSKITFLPEKGAELNAEIKYVSTTPRVEQRSDWYFTLSADELTRLAGEKFRGVRLIGTAGQNLGTYNFTNKGRRNLNNRAEEALKKLNEK